MAPCEFLPYSRLPPPMRTTRATMVTNGVRASWNPMTTKAINAATTRTPPARATLLMVMALLSRMHVAETTHPLLELDHGFVQMPAAHVGPQHLGEDELAVGDLPQQEIGDTRLSRGTDDQVGIGHVGEIEVTADGLLVHLVRRHPFGHQRSHRIDDLGPPAVVERHGHGHAVVALGQLDRLVHPLEYPARHPPVPPPGKTDAHALLVELVPAPHEQRLVEPHEVAHLVGRPAPVLGREGIERDPADPDLEGPVDHIEQRLFTGGVPLGPG